MKEWCRPTGGGWVGDWWVIGDDDELYDCEWRGTWYYDSGSPPPQPPPYRPYDDPGGGGSYPEIEPVEPTPTTPVSTCPLINDTLPDLDDPQDPSAFGGDTVITCSTVECMNAQGNGVWVGSWAIPLFEGNTNWRHAAIATIPPLKVSELIGWPETWSTNRFSLFESAPHYGSLADYKWVRVAGTSAVPGVTAAVAAVGADYVGELYYGTSNRFISSILKNSKILLTDQQRAALGKLPGICKCGACIE